MSISVLISFGQWVDFLFFLVIHRPLTGAAGGPVPIYRRHVLGSAASSFQGRSPQSSFLVCSYGLSSASSPHACRAAGVLIGEWEGLGQSPRGSVSTSSSIVPSDSPPLFPLVLSFGIFAVASLLQGSHSSSGLHSSFRSILEGFFPPPVLHSQAQQLFSQVIAICSPILHSFHSCGSAGFILLFLMGLGFICCLCSQLARAYLSILHLVIQCYHPREK